MKLTFLEVYRWRLGIKNKQVSFFSTRLALSLHRKTIQPFRKRGLTIYRIGVIGLLRKILSILFLLVAGTVVLMAQNQVVRISGNVKDNNGEILPYATVRLKNTSTGCITDYNGNFSFNGKVTGQTLVVSSIGYKDYEVALSSKTVFPLKIVLEETSYEIDDVRNGECACNRVLQYMLCY